VVKRISRGKKRDKGKVCSLYLNTFQLKTINGLKVANRLSFSDSVKQYFKEQESDSFKLLLNNQVKMLDILEGIKRFQPIINLNVPEQPKRLGSFWDRFRRDKL